MSVLNIRIENETLIIEGHGSIIKLPLAGMEAQKREGEHPYIMLWGRHTPLTVHLQLRPGQTGQVNIRTHRGEQVEYDACHGVDALQLMEVLLALGI